MNVLFEAELDAFLANNSAAIEISAVRSQGAGGQNVNKVASAIHLRFDLSRSTLPHDYQERLLDKSDRRISKDGIITIKAQRFRTQEQNRRDAQRRLFQLLDSVKTPKKQRIATKPSATQKRKRLDSKKHRSALKSTRSTPINREE